MDRLRIDTPQPSTPDAVSEVVCELAQRFAWQGPVGCTLPAIVKAGVTRSAANIDDGWIDFPAEATLRRRTGLPLRVSNDADAAGIAEMTFGAGAGTSGSRADSDPGHRYRQRTLLPWRAGAWQRTGTSGIKGPRRRKVDRQRRAQTRGPQVKTWGKRLNHYLAHLEFIFSPDLIILGGGVSRRFERFSPYLRLQTEVVPAALRNEAGIIGAALAARSLVADPS